MVALPAVLVSVNETRVGPTPLLMMAAFPAELVSANVMEPLLVMAALPAVLVPLKKLTPLFVRAALPAVLVLLKDRIPPLLMVTLLTVLALLNVRLPKLSKLCADEELLDTCAVDREVCIDEGAEQIGWCRGQELDCVDADRSADGILNRRDSAVCERRRVVGHCVRGSRVPVRALGPFVTQRCHTALPSAVDCARGLRRQHGERAEPDACEQHRAQSRVRRQQRSRPRDEMNRSAAHGLCRGARCF